MKNKKTKSKKPVDERAKSGTKYRHDARNGATYERSYDSHRYGVDGVGRGTY